MQTVDGVHWDCQVSCVIGTGTSVDYFYSIENGGRKERREWGVVAHRLEATCENGQIYDIYDHWIDIPEDSYLYTSAITDCVVGKKIEQPRITPFAKTVRLQVRAPQLSQGMALYVTGGEVAMGEWDDSKAIRMTEHNINEWLADIDAGELADSLIDFKFFAKDDATGNIVWEYSNNRSVQLPDLADGQVVVYDLSQAFFPLPPVRCAGTLVPVFSLRSRESFGVGDFGDLKKMIDWVAKTKQRVLQILPINDTTITHTWTDSYPYSCISIFALHPQYADLNQLPKIADKALADEMEQLRTNGTADFLKWEGHTSWNEDDRAALSNGRTKAYRDVAFYYFVQFILSEQMKAAHEYARANHVILKGDIPIGVNRFGCDVWSEPRYFNLNGQAGAPPDDFSVSGQNWGFPTYNWDEMIADGCQWWVRRFQNMQQYFDAYRIDHVLGFFRIWEIPATAVHGLLGHFSPALGMSREEIEGYGLHWQEDLFTTPFITDWVLDRVFHERAQEVREKYVEPKWEGHYRMRPEFDTQKKIEAAFEGCTEERDIWLRDGLYSLVSDVLFVRDHKDSNKFHPRISVQFDFIYENLYDSDKAIFNRLYNDYFYRRNNQFWYHEAMKKLPLLVNATRMLVCAEDLGMVPDCVEWVMNELRILSLELQSMPKDPKVRFGYLSRNPYRSVCTISSHDMPTLRQWWDENWERTQAYYNTMLHRGDAAPHPLPGWLARDILSRHLYSPSMLCIISIQDWMAMDENLRLDDPDAERINIPANPKHYWRYRMHVNLEDLMENQDFNGNMIEMITNSGRN